jgi:hypothetical protein
VLLALEQEQWYARVVYSIPRVHPRTGAFFWSLWCGVLIVNMLGTLWCATRTLYSVRLHIKRAEGLSDRTSNFAVVPLRLQRQLFLVGTLDTDACSER